MGEYSTSSISMEIILDYNGSNEVTGLNESIYVKKGHEKKLLASTSNK